MKKVIDIICVSLVLAVVNGIRILIMGQGGLLMAMTVGVSLSCAIIIAKVVGCTLPLVSKKVGLDPALMATPLITTLVDLSTISVYFAIASYVFSL